MTQEVRNLVFGGTGVRNPAYAGALMALEERGLYRGITSFAGTSAGSIVAALAGVGFTPEEVLTRVIGLDFSRIPGGHALLGPYRLLRKFGWFNADYLVEQLGSMIAEKMGDPMVDIATCERKTGNRIRIVGASLSRREACVFPDSRTPRIPLVEAVRISMSIPLFFQAVRLENELYVDGGVLWNLPLEVFDHDGEPDPGTLGVIVREPNESNPQSIRSVGEHAVAMFRTLIRSQEGSLDYRPAMAERVVQIDDLGISPVNFFLSAPQKWALVEAGRVATHALLEQREQEARPIMKLVPRESVTA
ncbi:MAG TPA: patatin-like phospholipase family protein [Polyangiales bacterium]